MRLSGTKTSSIHQYRGLGNQLYDLAGARPTLDLNFADQKSLVDATTGQNLVTFTRASSGTYVDSQGVIRTATTNEPRFDHNPTTGESLGLLVEEGRTNLLLYSEEFENAWWPKTRALVTSNAALAPNGLTTADKLVEDNTTSASHRIDSSTVSFPTGAITASLFAKASERTRVQISWDGSPGGTASSAVCSFDLSAGTAGTPSTTNNISSAAALIVKYKDGWYRLILTATATASFSGTFRINLLDASGNTTYSGDNVSGVFIWGAQLEAGAFPTSYIPTTTSAATRSADVASITGANFSSWYRQDEGTVFAENVLLTGNPPANTFPGVLSANNGTTTNQMMLYWGSSSSARWFVRESGTITADITATASANSLTRLAARYAANDAAISANGGSVATDSSVVLPTADRLTIGAQAGAAPLNGHIRRLTYWPARLSNNVLQEITR